MQLYDLFLSNEIFRVNFTWVKYGWFTRFLHILSEKKPNQTKNKYGFEGVSWLKTRICYDFLIKLGSIPQKISEACPLLEVKLNFLDLLYKTVFACIFAACRIFHQQRSSWFMQRGVPQSMAVPRGNGRSARNGKVWRPSTVSPTSGDSAINGGCL